MRAAIICLAVLLAGAVLVGYWAYSLWGEAILPADPGIEEATLVWVAPGTSTADVGRMLESQGLIRASWAFALLSRQLELDGRLQAGWYRVSPGMSPEEIMRIMADGTVATEWFVVQEGLTAEMTVAALVEQGMGDAEEFERVLADVSAAREWLPDDYEAGLVCPNFGLPHSALEGYLFPDTYEIPYGAGEEEIIGRMLDRFQSVWTEERLARAEELGLSVHEVVTLASIVERETAAEEERPLVASVFLNRLEEGMNLGACSTILYVQNRRDGPVLYEDQEVDSPYNTYMYGSLPPGPIASPGLASIDAVLHPEETDYLYFCSKGDGTHAFARTLAEHEQNRVKYLE
ncbi:MAG: endolytic transglycosylase MltG [Bacillota bacterium]